MDAFFKFNGCSRPKTSAPLPHLFFPCPLFAGFLLLPLLLYAWFLVELALLEFLEEPLLRHLALEDLQGLLDLPIMDFNFQPLITLPGFLL